jgi:hypothetical protein
MTHPHPALPSLAKETRALLPTFVATAAAISLGGLLDDRTAALVLVVFCWGVVALGAHSIGHEYSHRTLTLLLGQPRSRVRMLADKALVLIPMVLALTLITTLSLPGEGFEPLRQPGAPRTLLVLAALSALSVAPLLSMVGRGTLPATVFTVAIPGVFMVVAEVLGNARYGVRNTDSIWAFKLAFVQSSVLYVCAAAAIAVWWRFLRLQAIDGHQNLHIPAWLRSPTAGAAAPVRMPAGWLLIRKELHLQQISYAVVGLYVTAWLALWLFGEGPPDGPRVELAAVTVMYQGLIALLIGSVASAEERHLGTLSLQQLLPMAAWKQWAVKAGTAIGLAVLLAILLPVFLSALIPLPDNRLPARLPRQLMAVVVLSTFSLYVSSLCGSAVRAIVASIPLSFAAMLYGTATRGLVTAMSYRDLAQASAASQNRDARYAALIALQARTEYAMVLTLIVMVVLLLRFAFVNHRSDERRPSRTIAQAIVLVASFTLCLLSPLLGWR